MPLPRGRFWLLKTGMFYLIRFAVPYSQEISGGPEIAFRGGRVDAAEPNAPGVPQPQDALASHIAAFARQGFSQTEMIGLVACGYVSSSHPNALPS